MIFSKTILFVSFPLPNNLALLLHPHNTEKQPSSHCKPAFCSQYCQYKALQCILIIKLELLGFFFNSHVIIVPFHQFKVFPAYSETSGCIHIPLFEHIFSLPLLQLLLPGVSLLTFHLVCSVDSNRFVSELFQATSFYVSISFQFAFLSENIQLF